MWRGDLSFNAVDELQPATSIKTTIYSYAMASCLRSGGTGPFITGLQTDNTSVLLQ